MAALILLGLGTCDSCRKARTTLAKSGHDVEFRDVRAAPLESAEIDRLLEHIGPELVNRRSTTWRQLPPDEQAEFDTPKGRKGLLAKHSALMKRPVILDGEKVLAGWKPEEMASLSG